MKLRTQLGVVARIDCNAVVERFPSPLIEGIIDGSGRHNEIGRANELPFSVVRNAGNMVNFIEHDERLRVEPGREPPHKQRHDARLGIAYRHIHAIARFRETQL